MGCHTFYTEKDFTKEEIDRRNLLAVAVIEYDLKICKFCGYSKDAEVVEELKIELEKGRNNEQNRKKENQETEKTMDHGPTTCTL